MSLSRAVRPDRKELAVRTRIACLSLGLVVAIAGQIAAQEPASNAVSSAENRFTAELAYRPARPRVRTEKTEADLLIYRKAAALAQQRVARIELRKWQGVSLLRPNASTSRTGYDLNAALMAAPAGWYAGCGWWVR
ncbi:MAG TPA: hypothetical protein VML55_21900 [Planctomycetaceae bacterium]|nr:hypothetical protein [Planctomycetaceae bacterium]